ncbi:MAG: protein-methionine-sulfoxide reductase catalytic subunit MsrP [Neomegalonema sp.]|nr:protein-methionine-sulfoxide reductase catalytic subunit MsrP [Neomegalonema sp.]
MKLLRRPDWALPERAATPEPMFRNRRAFMIGGAATVAGGAYLLGGTDHAARADLAGEAWDPAAPRNPDFTNAGRPITDEATNSTYNNFYEFASHKRIYDKAQALPTEGWTLEITGEVEQPMTLDMDALRKKMPIEERVIRHRCVEAWSMVVPWIGFELAALMKRAAPLSSAKFVEFKSFLKPEIADGQRARYYPWAYTEGLTIEEAANPLTFMVMGAYGKVLPKQFGAPIRLHVPWKYGFKSAKSITTIRFAKERPVSFWEELGPREYGFWANVNPEVRHPRWSQATEEVLGTGERVPTQIYNGYGAQVAHLYSGMSDLGDKLFR